MRKASTPPASMEGSTEPSLESAKKYSDAEMKRQVAECSLRHVAIIMDGNRRWAETKHLPKVAGHGQGVEALKKIVRHAGEIGLEALTVYAFSTENWQRTPDEVGYLMKLFVEALSKELERLHENRVRILFIGDLTPFPAELRSLLEAAMIKTQGNTGLKFQVAVNYGSRAELVRAMQEMARDVQAGCLTPDAIDEAMVSSHLYTAGLPDPDLLIRTGGEYRVSNYLLWQCAYTELYTTPLLWPEFNEPALNQAVLTYASRHRRFGI